MARRAGGRAIHARNGLDTGLFVNDISLCGELTEHEMREFVSIAKALADENRLRALMALRGKELCVCQMTELLGLAPSTVSKHMSILAQARLVEGRKDGRWMFYRLADGNTPADARRAMAWACASLEKDPRVRKDAGRLKRIVKLDPEELCRRQAKG